MLVMYDDEKMMRDVMASATLFIIILNFVLIANYGAAVAIHSALALMVQNRVVGIVVWQRLGIQVFPFARSSRGLA